MTGVLTPGPHRAILRGWAILAVAALALAGIALIVPALSKMPGLADAVAWPDAFFQKGLVAHVALSFVVWFLAVTAMIALTAPRASDRHEPMLPGATALALGIAGTLAIAGAPLIEGAEPSLNNYIPSIIHPVYFAGLAAVAAGVLIAVLTMLARLGHAGPAGSERVGLLSLGLLYVAALIAVALAAWELGERPRDYDTVERLFWGGGHLLQFVNVALLLIALDRLGRSALGAPPMGEAATRWAMAILFFAGAGGLSIYGLTDIRSAEHIQAFTDLQYAFAVPVLIAAGGMVVHRRRWRGADFGRIDTVSLIAAGLVFALGCAMGLFVDGADTRTPAHYHGVIGGINIAFYGLFYMRFLPALGRPIRHLRLAIGQIILYALGQSLFVAGLFAAGGMGAARKTMGTGIELDGWAAHVALSMRDFGLAVALLSSAVFVVLVLVALVRRPSET